MPKRGSLEPRCTHTPIEALHSWAIIERRVGRLSLWQLKSKYLFQSLSKKQVDEIVELMAPRPTAAGEEVIRQVPAPSRRLASAPRRNFF